MPGHDDNIVQENIKELMRTGRPEAQATAIAMKAAGKSRKAAAPSGKGGAAVKMGSTC